MGHLGLRRSLRHAGANLEQSISHLALEIGELFVDMSGLIWLCLLRHVDLLGWIKAGDPVGGLADEDNVSARMELASFLAEVGHRAVQGRETRGLKGAVIFAFSTFLKPFVFYPLP